ncbi:MAG: (2Fe-2S)-binding protein [Actinomycetota bacterium]
MDDEVIICRCEEVTKGEILKAIGEGARTITGVKTRTRAGMGLCQGRTCGRLMARLLAERTGQALEKIPPATVRPPVRATKMENLVRPHGE